MKDVPRDYCIRLQAVEEQLWWHTGMREITEVLLRGRLACGHLSLLDAGCRTGGFLAWASETGAFDRLCGADISAEAPEFIRRTVPNAELHPGAATRPPVWGSHLRPRRAERRAPAR